MRIRVSGVRKGEIPWTGAIAAKDLRGLFQESSNEQLVAEDPAPAKKRTRKPAAPKSPALSEHKIQLLIVEMLRRKGWMVVHANGGGARRGPSYVFNYIIYGYVRYFSGRVVKVEQKDGTTKLEKIIARNGEGFPDLAAFKGDRFIFGEVKRKGGKLEESQKRFIEFAALHGISVPVFDDWRAAFAFVDGL